MAAAETVRSAAESSGSRPDERKPEDERISIFWRVFGGTILSIVALVTITLFNNLWSNITELRGEINREREARAGFVKEDEFRARSTSIYERIRAHDGLKVEYEGLKERVNANAAALEGVKKDTAASIDGMKKDSASLEILKERVQALDAVRKEVAGIDSMKEKLTATATDLKGVRDDLLRLQQDVERNKASDLERKASRDAQQKQVEESLKEVQKALQDCREKLARLEGSPPTTPRGTTAEPKGSKSDASEKPN